MAIRFVTPPFLQRHANRMPLRRAPEARVPASTGETRLTDLADRLRQECVALTLEYRTLTDFGCDPAAGFWVHLADWPLPAGMNRPSAPLIVLVPEDYPRAAPTALFLPGDLSANAGWTPARLLPSATGVTAPEPWQVCGGAQFWREDDDLARLLVTLQAVMECACRLG